MAKNPGKSFEEDFKNSVPDDWFCYRLRDSSGSWSNTSTSRFTPTNICDFILFTGKELYCLEMKSVKNKSLSFGNISSNPNSQYKKLKELADKSAKENSNGAYIVNFRSIEETYFIEIYKFLKFYEETSKKSINVEDVRKIGRLIECRKKKVRYEYFLEGVF